MTWDYEALIDCNLTDLKSAGRQGWELCAVIPNTDGKYVFYFKRRQR